MHRSLNGAIMKLRHHNKDNPRLKSRKKVGRWKVELGCVNLNNWGEWPSTGLLVVRQANEDEVREDTLRLDQSRV